MLEISAEVFYVGIFLLFASWILVWGIATYRGFCTGFDQGKIDYREMMNEAKRLQNKEADKVQSIVTRLSAIVNEFEEDEEEDE